VAAQRYTWAVVVSTVAKVSAQARQDQIVFPITNLSLVESLLFITAKGSKMYRKWQTRRLLVGLDVGIAMFYCSNPTTSGRR
jgi:hypothetical protein